MKAHEYLPSDCTLYSPHSVSVALVNLPGVELLLGSSWRAGGVALSVVLPDGETCPGVCEAGMVSGVLPFATDVAGS